MKRIDFVSDCQKTLLSIREFIETAVAHGDFTAAASALEQEGRILEMIGTASGHLPMR